MGPLLTIAHKAVTPALAVGRFFKQQWDIAGREKAVSKMQREIEATRAEHARLFKEDAEVQGDLAHGVVLRLQQPVLGEWSPAGRVNLLFLVEVENRWYFDFALNEVEIRLPFTTRAGQPQGVKPRTQLPGFRRDFREHIPVEWDPQNDPVRDGPSPDRASIVAMTIQAAAHLDGPFGPFTVSLHVQQVVLLISPQGLPKATVP